MNKSSMLENLKKCTVIFKKKFIIKCFNVNLRKEGEANDTAFLFAPGYPYCRYCCFGKLFVDLDAVD